MSHFFAMPPVIVVLFVAWIGLMSFGAWTRFAPGPKRRRMLSQAIGRGDLDVVKQLVADGLDLNSNSAAGAVSLAALRKDPSIVDFLVANGASLSPKLPGNEALLSNAALGGNFKLVDLALAAGHDIHFKPRNCSKPLARAIHRNLVPTARFLISRGADIRDLSAGDCRWHAMRIETVLLVQELGMEVPPDVLTAIRNGQWV